MKKRILSVIMCFCLVMCLLPISAVSVQAAAISYSSTYTGKYTHLDLGSGTYLLKDCTADATGTGKPGISITAGANVTLVIEGDVKIIGSQGIDSRSGGFAGIYITSGNQFM